MKDNNCKDRSHEEQDKSLIKCTKTRQILIGDTKVENEN